MWYNSVMKIAYAGGALSLALAAGCWTFGTSEYPQVALAPAAGMASNVVLRVEGFAATFTEYDAVYGYSTVYVPGVYGRRHYRHGYYETVQTSAFVPSVRSTDAYLKRAKTALEDAGYVVAGAPQPDFVIEVNFGGPTLEPGDFGRGLAWKLCTVFFCDYEAEDWTADLRVRDNRTGRIVLHRNYVQRYETKVFGLIPIFGIASCAETSSSFMRNWCLGALTDRIVADLTAAPELRKVSNL